MQQGQIDTSLHEVARWIQDARSVMVLTGAGIFQHC